MSTPDRPELTRTTRDPEELRERLSTWLAARQPGASIESLRIPSDNGMSSDTVLFDATWPDGGGELVARLAAAEDASPVFPSYDLESQFRVMDLVRQRTDAPVPRVRWLETDPTAVGSEFFVMDRVEGWVPPDVMPYTMEGSMLEAGATDLRHLQDRSVEVLAAIHGADLADGAFDFLEVDQPGDTALRRHVVHWRHYVDWVLQGRQLPLIDEAWAWLRDNWPAEADARPPALSWGDARIGNMMYSGFDPVGVFDWEMAGIAPVEVDLGWMCFLHIFFQDITEELGMPGLPDFMAPADVAGHYAAVSGRTVGDLRWFMAWAAFRHAAIMVRIHDRQVHFGEAEPHADLADAVLHRNRLRTLTAD